jgi:plasmid stabilization system protein ParE
MRIVYRLEALADLNDHLTFIARDNPAAARRVGERIREAIGRLEMFPLSGRTGSVAGTYELVVPRLPYIAVYRVTSFVEIIAIFHAAQDRSEDVDD